MNHDFNPKISLPGHLQACLYGSKQGPNMMMCWGPAWISVGCGWPSHVRAGLVCPGPWLA
jgi:hypothetical protein